MTTCDRCGRPSDGFTCTLCRSLERERQEDIEREERAQEERLEQAREDAERLVNARVNPGDYECPACLYRTLKKRASRCPMCQTNVGTEHWNRIDEREKEATERARVAAKLAQEKWEREAPARAQAARDAAERKLRAAAADRYEGILVAFSGIYFCYLLPALCPITVALIVGGPSAVMQFLRKLDGKLILIPILNWFIIALVLLFSHDRLWVLLTVSCLAAAGAVAYFAISREIRKLRESN